nr:gag pol polyprotein [Hymenolepis microstoma]
MNLRRSITVSIDLMLSLGGIIMVAVNRIRLRPRKLRILVYAIRNDYPTKRRNQANNLIPTSRSYPSDRNRDHQPSIGVREKRLDQLFVQVELGDRPPSQLLRHMRSLANGSSLTDEILKKLWMKCLPKTLIPFLVTSSSRDNLDKLAEEADLIYNPQDGPDINAVKVPTVADSITQRLDELAKQLQELKALRFSTSPRINRRHPTSPRRWRSPARHDDTVCYHHRMYGDKAKKCQPGCNYPSTDSAFSNLNPTRPERNIIPRSAVKCYLQLTNLTLRPNNNHLSNICTLFSSVHAIKRQN